MQRLAHIVAARRSPVAPRGGDLATLELHALAAPVIRAVLGDAGIGAAQVDEIIVSNALGAGGNPARLVALAADLPQRIGGYSIDRQCCGGLDALALAPLLKAPSSPLLTTRWSRLRGARSCGHRLEHC